MVQFTCNRQADKAHDSFSNNVCKKGSYMRTDKEQLNKQQQKINIYITTTTKTLQSITAKKKKTIYSNKTTKRMIL